MISQVIEMDDMKINLNQIRNIRQHECVENLNVTASN